MRKAQIQLGETIMILIVFIVLVLIGFIGYTAFAKNKIKEEGKEQTRLSANEIAQRVMWLPEVMCSNNNIPVHNCFDLEKLKAAKDIMTATQNRNIYYDLFYQSEISVNIAYQPYSLAVATTSYTLYENIPPESKTMLLTMVPITIHNPAAEKGNDYYFGLLTVKVYS